VTSAWSDGSGTVRRFSRWIISACSTRIWERSAGATAIILSSASSCRISTAGMALAASRIFSNDRWTSRS